MGKGIYTRAELVKVEAEETRVALANGHAESPIRPTAGQIDAHPIANLYPLMRGEAFKRHVASIRTNGQHEEIALLDGRILDGRNRYRACIELGIEPRTREFGSRPEDGDDPVAFTRVHNVDRRQLNESQRAMVAARMATLGEGRPDKTASIEAVSQDDAADLLGVSRSSVQRARTVIGSGVPQLVDLVDDGHVKVSKAANLLERPEADLDALLRRVIERIEDGEDPGKALSAAEGDTKNGVPGSAPVVDRTSGRGKPAWLMRALVRHYSRLGEVVCDPLAGFGSTLHAALDEGRQAIGSEIDADVAKAAGELPIRSGDWRIALADVDAVDSIICDPPYSERTHAAATTRNDGSSAVGLTPTYAGWSEGDVNDFVSAWSPRCRGWMVALTDSELLPAWRDAYRAAGRYAFAPVPVVIRGMSNRATGDGPASWAVYAVVARPKTPTFLKWGALDGAYVGTRTRDLSEALRHMAEQDDVSQEVA